MKTARVVMPKVRIGENLITATSNFTNKDIPCNVLAVGLPVTTRNRLQK